MGRWPLAWPAVAVAVLALAACGGAADPPGAGAPPQRIVALAPSLTEILFALGLGERVVGVGDYGRWPPEIEAKPRLGGLFDPRREAIVALEPDLAVLLPSQAELADELRRLGIEVLTVRAETIRDVEAAIRTVAARCGVPEAGEELAARFQAGLEPRPLPGRPTVLLAVGRPPGRLASVLVAGPGTFLDELLARLGAENAFGDSPLAYPEVGLEEILARRPEAIVELRPRAAGAREASALLADWRALPELPAAAAGCLAVIGGSYAVLPGPRLPRLYRELREALAACREGG